jgi:hypothetical protein
VRKSNLDPLLAPALELERRPVIPARVGAAEIANSLLTQCERIASMAAIDGDPHSAAQLLNTAEALGACVINLLAYSRGVVPRVSNKPNVNLIVPNG